MAEIVYLKVGQSPPETEDWIIVQPQPSGSFEITAAVADHSKGATFSYESGLSGRREIVIARAVQRADRDGVAKVYVYGEAE